MSKPQENWWDKFNAWEGSGCVWMIAIFLVLAIYGRSCSGGSELPLNVRSEDLGNPTIELAGEGEFDAQEYNQNKDGSSSQDQLENEYYYDRLTRTLQADWTQSAQDALGDMFPNPPEYTSSCPQGCYAPPYGCTIKGNVSFYTKEKIYHMPGDPYYDQTTINTDYGERWFCTEAEARENGWRRAAH
jgi:hypothetical protein